VGVLREISTGVLREISTGAGDDLTLAAWTCCLYFSGSGMGVSLVLAFLEMDTFGGGLRESCFSLVLLTKVLPRLCRASLSSEFCVSGGG
jgi:hypothetical protein